jgi:hypothetical protein
VIALGTWISTSETAASSEAPGPAR